MHLKNLSLVVAVVVAVAIAVAAVVVAGNLNGEMAADRPTVCERND